MLTPPATERERRAAMIANVLARAVRDREAEATDALRILHHELRRLNTGKKQTIPVRSVAAQQVIDRYAVQGRQVPNNNSDHS